MLFQTLSTVAALAATVSAHGYVTNLTAGGVDYTGYLINTDPYTVPTPARVVRPVQGNGPITDVTLIDIQCGGYTAGGINGSSPANLTAGPVAAGSDVEIAWSLWPSSHFGPVITYMAKCPDAGCQTYLPGTDAVWFKVQEEGRTGTSDVWATTPLMTAGGTASYTIPSCLAAGDYLVRHEIIAVFTAVTYPGAQFYPSCHQISITGSGSSTGPTEKVAFPGAYTPTSAGVTFDNSANATYTIPGPTLFTC
ncbi:hypothetical protein BP6252_02814 [Coleophoma cylindrospora]|uniref:lytic cellulose monooxygenase (C4-dehydrogenating) n=1 Tax=Coleophoma cylindrospora TaxID=1849047 RepID=A0A3D8SGE8_9HELO|nr:hypothetical protein BP6252_02814 [Coleophoma cylindrospora]